MNKEIKLLIRWLKNNRKSHLADILGYDDTRVIDNWVKRKSIPSYQLDRVLEIINGGTENERISSAG